MASIGGASRRFFGELEVHVAPSAEPLARREPFTPAWFALRTAKSVFYIVDAFVTDADRDKHLGGEIAKALMAKAGELLAEPPAIEKAEVLASKLPGDA